MFARHEPKRHPHEPGIILWENKMAYREGYNQKEIRHVEKKGVDKTIEMFYIMEYEKQSRANGRPICPRPIKHGRGFLFTPLGALRRQP